MPTKESNEWIFFVKKKIAKKIEKKESNIADDVPEFEEDSEEYEEKLKSGEVVASRDVG